MQLSYKDKSVWYEPYVFPCINIEYFLSLHKNIDWVERKASDGYRHSGLARRLILDVTASSE